GYVAPSKFGPGYALGPTLPAPPGFLSDVRRGRSGSSLIPVGRNSGARDGETGGERLPRFTGGLQPRDPGRLPAWTPRDEDRPERGGSRIGAGRPAERPLP